MGLLDSNVRDTLPSFTFPQRQEREKNGQLKEKYLCNFVAVLCLNDFLINEQKQKKLQNKYFRGREKQRIF